MTITQLDPIAVAFSLPQRNLGDALATLRAGGGKVDGGAARRRAARSTGKLQFVDNTVDAASGTVRVKAEFANKDERLWPGAFVTIRLAVQTLKDASVIPQAAIIQSPRGKIVYVVDAEHKAAPRPVEVRLRRAARTPPSAASSRASGSSSTGARTCAPAPRWSSAPATEGRRGAASAARRASRRRGLGARGERFGDAAV